MARSAALRARPRSIPKRILGERERSHAEYCGSSLEFLAPRPLAATITRGKSVRLAGTSFARSIDMHPLPHHYTVAATVSAEGEVSLGSPGAVTFPSAAPPEFGGPRDRWSPETLLVGAAVDCFAITFQGLAQRSHLAFVCFECKGEGVLDRVKDGLAFVELRLSARVVVRENTSRALAERLVRKAEASCLVTRSLTAEVKLAITVQTPDEADELDEACIAALATL